MACLTRTLISIFRSRFYCLFQTPAFPAPLACRIRHSHSPCDRVMIQYEIELLHFIEQFKFRYPGMFQVWSTGGREEGNVLGKTTHRSSSAFSM
jgi:hypothetical protein